MWQNTSIGDCGADECVELLVTADGELEMARRDALDLEILGGVACKFQDFSGEVFQDSRQVDGGLGADARLLARDGTEVTLYTAARKLDRDAKSARRRGKGLRRRNGRGSRIGHRRTRSRAGTDLQTCFGRVRLGRLDMGVALAAGLASCLSCASGQLLEASMTRTAEPRAYLCRLAFWSTMSVRI